jgi:REP element-mobilizing transposase RayT
MKAEKLFTIAARKVHLSHAGWDYIRTASIGAYLMTRFARVVAVDVPHHVTQRGNARPFILATEADCKVYMDLLRQNLELHSLALLGYCLMANDVHLILVPEKVDALGRALTDTHADLRPTGMPPATRPDISGRADSTHARWTSSISGRPYGIPS